MTQDGRTAPTRRRLLRTAAWTAPAVVAASASPAYADSGKPEGRIVADQSQLRGTLDGDRVVFPTITGTVSVTSGPLPTRVVISFSGPNERVDLRRDAGLTVPIDPATGAFSIDGVYNAIVGGENPFGFVYIGVDDAADVTYGLVVVELDG